MKRPAGSRDLADPDCLGRCGDSQGPFYVIAIKLRDGLICDASFRTFLCPWAVAVGSALMVQLSGKTPKEASTIEEAVIEVELGGIPRDRRYCISMALQALRSALNQAA